MKKVLIISYSYPPFNNIAARRFSEMVPFFYKKNWKPYILTTVSEGDLDGKINDEQIIRVGQHPELKLGIKYNKSFKSKFSNLRRKLGFCFRVFDSALFKWSNEVLSDEKILLKLQHENFDVIISSYGPSSALRLGSKLSTILNIPLIQDFRDLAALHQSDQFQQNLIAKMIDSSLEKKYVNKAKAFTTVSNGLAEELRRKYTKNVEVIYNGWSDMSQPSKKESTSEKYVPYIYYAGRFYEHQLESILILITQLKNTEYNLVIRSLGPKVLEKRILYFAQSNKVQDRVIILPATSAEIVCYEQSFSEINLVVEDLSKQHRSSRGVLTGKFLQLLTFSSPVLAIARDDSEIGEILKETQKGGLTSTAADLDNFFKSLKTNKNFYKGNGKIRKFSKENQADRMCHLLDSLL